MRGVYYFVVISPSRFWRILNVLSRTNFLYFFFFFYRSEPVRESSHYEEEEEEEILGSDDDEQEDPKDYCKGK